MHNIDDHVTTRRLANIYCSAVDDGNAELMSSLFVPSGRLVVYSPGALPGSSEPLRCWTGASDFARLISVLKKSYLRWVHFLGNHWVDVNGDRASGEAYLLACHLRQNKHGDEEEEVAVIRYRDSYIRTSDGWRFEERNACRQWTTLRAIDSKPHDIDTFLKGTLAKP